MNSLAVDRKIETLGMTVSYFNIYSIFMIPYDINDTDLKQNEHYHTWLML